MMRNKSEVLKRIKLAILGYLAKAVERQNGPKWPIWRRNSLKQPKTKEKTSTAPFPQFGYS